MCGVMTPLFVPEAKLICAFMDQWYLSRLLEEFHGRKQQDVNIGMLSTQALTEMTLALLERGLVLTPLPTR